jgi:hypothetical protein
MGISCACMPATAGFFNRGNGGQRIISGVSQVFGLHSLRSKYGKGSNASKSKESSLGGSETNTKSLGKIRAKTYINIDRDDSSTQNLNSMELDSYNRV